MMMMMQMPIVMVQRMPWVRRRTLLNNVLFWCSMILGLSLVSICHGHCPFYGGLFANDWFADVCALCACLRYPQDGKAIRNRRNDTTLLFEFVDEILDTNRGS
jgi:hypothetical protein